MYMYRELMVEKFKQSCSILVVCVGKGGYSDCGACRSGMWLETGTLGRGHVCLCRLEEHGRRDLVMTVPGGR